MMGVFAFLAETLRYPAPGRLQALSTGLEALPEGEVKRYCAAFLDGVCQLSLGEWEELYTRTLDLNPPTAPYIGFQMWGESYQRGEFMARLNRALHTEGIDGDGELPDHLIPVLRYLDSTSQPLGELLVTLEPAVKRMEAVLRKADPRNPYLAILEAILQSVRPLTSQVISEP